MGLEIGYMWQEPSFILSLLMRAILMKKFQGASKHEMLALTILVLILCLR